MAPDPTLEENHYFKSVFKSWQNFSDKECPEKVFLITTATNDIAVCFFIFQLNNEWMCEYSRVATGGIEKNQISKNNEQILLEALKFWGDLLQMKEVQWTILADVDVDESNSEDNIQKALNEIRSVHQNLSNGNSNGMDDTNGFVEYSSEDNLFSGNNLYRAAQFLIENDTEGFFNELCLKHGSIVNVNVGCN